MTVVAEHEVEPTGTLSVVEPEVDRPRARPTVQFRRAGLWLATAAFTAIIAVVLFQGPLGHVWFQTRQQHLAADLGAKRPGTRTGQALAILQIPRINLDLVVVEGDGPAQLRGGPGHQTGTPPPGELGNSVIFGHRAGWGAPFSKLGQLQVKDQIVIKKRVDNLPLLFQVVSVARVSQDDARPLAPSTDHRLTLVTALGGRFSTDRMVIAAVSGETGTVAAAGRVPAGLAPGSKVLNDTVFVLITVIAVLAASARLLRRRHRSIAVAVVTLPLGLAAVLALLLELDLLLLPPLH